MTKVRVSISWGWVGIPDDICEFETESTDLKEIEKEAYEAAEELIFERASYNYEVLADE